MVTNTIYTEKYTGDILGKILEFTFILNNFFQIEQEKHQYFVLLDTVVYSHI